MIIEGGEGEGGGVDGRRNPNFHLTFDETRRVKHSICRVALSSSADFFASP